MRWCVWYARAESGTRHPPASCTKINPSINFPCRRPGLTAEIRRSAALPCLKYLGHRPLMPSADILLCFWRLDSAFQVAHCYRKKKSDRVQTVTPLCLAESLQFPLVSLTAFQSRAPSTTFFPSCVTPQTNRRWFYFYVCNCVSSQFQAGSSLAD